MNHKKKYLHFYRNKKSFTLLELIIVIIIIAVLVSLALPRYIKMIEKVRAAEALQNIGVINRQMTACIAYHGANACGNCSLNEFGSMNGLGMEDPGLAAGAHFTYETDCTFNKPVFSIIATRTTFKAAVGAGDMIVYASPEYYGIGHPGGFHFSGVYSSYKFNEVLPSP